MVSPTNISAPAKTTSTHRASIATSHYFLGVAYIDHTLYKFLNKLVVHSQNQNSPVWNNRHLELTTGLLISCSWLTLSFFLDNIPIKHKCTLPIYDCRIIYLQRLLLMPLSKLQLNTHNAEIDECLEAMTLVLMM